jgi:broad specificity phosphatase PhoE
MHLIFVRHGAALDVEDRCIGQTDVSLSPAGADAIRALAAAASDFGPTTRIVSSDLRRASESAKILAAAWALPIAYDARLREMNFGSWDGCSWSAIEAEDGARFRAWTAEWVDSRTPDGEGVADVAKRAASWLGEIRAETRSQRVVVVSHAGWIRAAVSELLEWPLSAIFELAIDHARATVVRIDAAGARLIASNVDRIP